MSRYQPKREWERVRDRCISALALLNVPQATIYETINAVPLYDIEAMHRLAERIRVGEFGLPKRKPR